MEKTEAHHPPELLRVAGDLSRRICFLHIQPLKLLVCYWVVGMAFLTETAALGQIGRNKLNPGASSLGVGMMGILSTNFTESPMLPQCRSIRRYWPLLGLL